MDLFFVFIELDGINQVQVFEKEELGYTLPPTIEQLDVISNAFQEWGCCFMVTLQMIDCEIFPLSSLLFYQGKNPGW